MYKAIYLYIMKLGPTETKSPERGAEFMTGLWLEWFFFKLFGLHVFVFFLFSNCVNIQTYVTSFTRPNINHNMSEPRLSGYGLWILCSDI